MKKSVKIIVICLIIVAIFIAIDIINNKVEQNNINNNIIDETTNNINENYISNVVNKNNKVIYYTNKALSIKNKDMTYINEIFSWDNTIYDIRSIAFYNIGKYKASLKNINIAISMDKTNERLINNKKIIENILFITAAKIQYKNKRKSFSAMESSSFYYSFRVILTY